MRKLALMLMLSGTLIACQTTEQALKESGKTPLSAAQIEQALAGNTVTGTSSSGHDFTGFYGKDGKVRILVGSREDKGTWRVTKSNTICTKYSWIRGGSDSCRRWYKVGEEFQSVQLDGSSSSKFKIIQGNPQKL